MITRTASPRVLQHPLRRISQRSFSTVHLKNGVDMAYDLHEPPKESASGAPILFIHGLFGSKQNNRTMSKIFARELKRPVYAIDLRNHGDSSHDPRHDYTALAEDIELFLQQKDLRNSTLIGHSMGAKAAMAVALRRRFPIANLIPVDNSPVDAALKSDFGKYMQGMRKVEDLGVKKQSDADTILKDYEESLPIRQFLLTNLTRSSDGVQKFRVPLKYLASALNNMADFPFNDPDEVRWEGPTLFIRGTKSHYIADEMLPTIGRFFPKFQLVDVEAGHWLISEKPEEFRSAVIEFLQDKD